VWLRVCGKVTLKKKQELDFYGQMDALIKYWLHELPAEDMDEYTTQAAQAVFVEERYFKNLNSSKEG